MVKGRTPWSGFEVIQGEGTDVDQAFVADWIDRFRKLMREEFLYEAPLTDRTKLNIEVQMVKMVRRIEGIYASIKNFGVDEDEKVFADIPKPDIMAFVDGFRSIVQELYVQSVALADGHAPDEPDYCEPLEILDLETQEYIVCQLFDESLEIFNMLRELGFKVGVDQKVNPEQKTGPYEVATKSPVLCFSSDSIIPAIDLFVFTRHNEKLRGAMEGEEGVKNLISLLNKAQELCRTARAMPGDLDEVLADFELDGDADFELDEAVSIFGTHSAPPRPHLHPANIPIEPSQPVNRPDRSGNVSPRADRSHLSIVRKPDAP